MAAMTMGTKLRLIETAELQYLVVQTQLVYLKKDVLIMLINKHFERTFDQKWSMNHTCFVCH